uniref:Cleavage/polyadenylation specificity factor A subunit C-terminal domain-containing protein n=1 Tax=Heliothis virescens TaxID=7102 RepID=A0A2A4JWZ2_HELVI
MFSICRQTHPATGIEHSVSSCFFNNDETCLITAGANILKVFRLLPEGHTKEVNAAGQPIPPKMKLECLATYTLWGNVMSLASVRCPSAGRDLILVSFREAKLSVLQYDPQTDNLITLSMHYFEEDDMKNGWTTHPHIPWIRVDPECRCAVMLLYGKKLAVLPFRKDITNEDGDPLEAKPLDSKKALPTQTINRAPTLASYVIVLKDLDEKIDNILDIQFLHGYYEPTLLLLYEPVRTFAGRTAVRNDTCAMCGVSLNMSARVHPVIWATAHLPFDCLRAVPVQKPLGGCLIMAVNSLIYLNQSVPPYGVSLNSIATHTTNFPLRIQEGVCITLDGSCVAGLGEGRFALSLRGGQLYVLTLLADSVRTVRSFHLDRAAASVLTTCLKFSTCFCTMNNEGENLEFCDSSGSDVMEEEVLGCEQQVNVEVHKGNEDNITLSQKTPEKRAREESEEIVEEDEGFITVRKGKKRLTSNLANNTENRKDNGQMDRNWDVQQETALVVVISKEVLPKQFGMAKLLKAENIPNILRIQYKSPYKNRKSQMKEPEMAETMDFMTTTTTRVNKPKSYRDAAANNSFEALEMDDETHATDTSEDEEKRADYPQTQFKKKDKKKKKYDSTKKNSQEKESISKAKGSCEMCVIEEDFLFLGSRLGNSLLLRVTERENRMLFSVDKPLEATVDLTVAENEQQINKEQQIREQSDPASKKRRLDTISDCVATNVIEISDKDELEVYGSDIRTSTQLTSYVFEVCDSLLNICPIGDVSMGEPQLVSEELPRTPDNPAIELVACSGRGKNGALTVLQRTVRPQLITAFNLPGCLDMWSVLGEGTEGTREADGTHAYLILTQEDGSMVLQTGQEINEVDNSGFMTGSPTIFAGNLGNNKFMVQVTTTGIRLIKNGVQLQSVQLEWTAAYAGAADPYVCVQSLCNRVLVLALREFRGKDGASSGRLAPTRQTVPHRPGVLRATVYRDLSGLFTPPDAPNAQVKGEFTGKMKGKNVKAEGFKPGAVYELNDEDELLYGGDQTPASMASIMLAEQSKNPGVPRRISRWWKKYLVEVKPTYWLFVLRINGNLEIYSLPEMRLSFLVRDACAGNTILADSLESVPIPSGGIEDEELNSGGQNVDADKCRELLVVGVGHKGTRVLMLMRCEDQLMIYQAYKYPRGNLKLRFSRSRVSFPFGYNAAPLTEPTDSYETALLKENVRQCRYFGNVGGYNGVFICGATPYFLFLSARGELRLHPLCAEEAPVPTFAPFNNTNCPQGFLYFNAKSSLRISALPTHLSYDAWWPVRKVPLRVTPHFVTFHLESKTYCLVASTHQPTTSYYKFNGEDKEKTSDNKGDRFPYPLQDRFFVTLFSPVSWEIIPNTRIELDEWEHVTCLKNVCLSYEGTRSGLRGYIAIGTNYNYSEDITSRGRIIIYDIIDVVPEPGQPLTKNRFKELYAKEQKGPVTALTQVLGYLISAVGQKIYIWQLKDNDLVGVAFIDTQIYVHKMLSVKNLVLVADVYKSISLLRYQAQHRTLSLVSRDLRSAQIYEMEFMVDNTSLGFLVSEADGNLALFMYLPHARESYGGQRLIRKSDYHLGQQVNAMFRIAATHCGTAQRHVTMFTTLDGGVGYVLPITEKMYRRLLMLQNVMNNYCCHIAGLNPRAYRTYKSRRSLCGGAMRGILDGDLVTLYTTMPNAEKADIAKKIGTKVEEIMSDLYEIDRLTAHF